MMLGDATDKMSSTVLLTIPELADQLRIDKRTVNRLLKTGRLPLPIVHIGASPRIRRIDLDRYLEKLTNDAADADQARRSAAVALLRSSPRKRA
jgi:excisionase family DNA binding protein